MTKVQLATLMYEAQLMVQTEEHSIERLTQIVSQTMSAISTAHPDVALDIIEQMETKKPEILQLKAERQQEKNEYVSKMVASFSDSIEFQTQYN